MMKRHLIGLAGILLVTMTSAAAARTKSFAQAGALIAHSCGPSIERFCSNVNIGAGDLIACLRRNHNRVPASCLTDYQKVVAGINRRMTAQNDAFRICEPSARQFCAGVQPGDSHILNCLIKSQRLVRPACRQVLIDAGWK